MFCAKIFHMLNDEKSSVWKYSLYNELQRKTSFLVNFILGVRQMTTTIVIFFLAFILNAFDSIEIGSIRHASVRTNTSLISTSSPNCLDCLCDCLSNKAQVNSMIPTCYGINCFPSNQLCQRIEQLWIQETNVLFNMTSDQFINTIDINFCSCFSVQNILNKFENVTPISIAHPNARFVTYNAYDDTLIVLGDNLIGHYYASNLTRFQNFSTTNIPLAVSIDYSKNIYISFGGNMSINKYDMNMKFNQSIKRPTNLSGNSNLYGLALWKNYLLVTDDQLSLIWSLDLNTMNMSIYFNLTSYNITPFNIAVYNDNLYISQFSSPIIYIFNLISISVQNIIFANSIELYRLQMDPFCNRLWFGTKTANYTSVPVFDLGTNTAYIYQAKGLLAQSRTYKVEFDLNYSMYTVATNGNYFFKYQMSNISCRNN